MMQAVEGNPGRQREAHASGMLIELIKPKFDPVFYLYIPIKSIRRFGWSVSQ